MQQFFYIMRRLLQNASVQLSMDVGFRGETVEDIIGELITSCEHFKIQKLICWHEKLENINFRTDVLFVFAM